MANIFDSAKTIQEKRIILRQLSDGLKDLVKIGQFESVNDGLKAVYAQSGHVVLKTMKQWNKEGKRVTKVLTLLGKIWYSAKQCNRIFTKRCEHNTAQQCKN